MSNANQKRKRPSKKTEMLEVRVSPEEKAAFLDACRNVGRSASEVIRDAMRAYSDFGPMTRLPRSGFMLVSAFLGASAGAYALINFTGHPEDAPAAHAAIAQSEFRDFDRNRDNLLSLTEYRAGFPDFRPLVELGLGTTQDFERASAINHGFGGMDVNFFAITIDPSNLSEACWQGAEERFLRRKEALFSNWDADGDEVVTLDEFSRHRFERLRESFNLHDVNADGSITLEDAEIEFNERMSRPTDSGSSITFEHPEPPFAAICREDVGGWTVTDFGQTRSVTPTLELTWRTYAGFDANRDGRVTLQEYAVRNVGY